MQIIKLVDKEANESCKRTIDRLKEDVDSGKLVSISAVCEANDGSYWLVSTEMKGGAAKAAGMFLDQAINMLVGDQLSRNPK